MPGGGATRGQEAPLSRSRRTAAWPPKRDKRPYGKPLDAFGRGHETPHSAAAGFALSTIFFSASHGVSRIVGLIARSRRAYYFGVTRAMSQFTIDFKVPNLVRGCRRRGAEGASCPSSANCSSRGRKREAIQVASASSG